MSNKSYFQQLSENLQEEVNQLKKLILEKSAFQPPTEIDYPATYDPNNPNKGGYAGLGVGAAANPTMIVANPKVIAQNIGLGTMLDKVVGDSFTKTNLPTTVPLASNVGYGLGLGYDKNTFTNTAKFVNQFGSQVLDDSQLDDPEQSRYINWKRMNDAVQNYHSQRVKQNLSKGYLFKGDVSRDGYEQGIPDTYNRNVFIPKNVKKVVDDTTNAILGKNKSFKGKNVSGYVKNMSGPEFQRFQNTWSKK